MDGRALGRYYSIIQGDSRARYLETKETAAGTPLDIDEEGLWAAHGCEHGAQCRRDAPSLLDLKVELADRMLASCTLCERMCRVDRTVMERGHCGVLKPRISSEFIHMGEEPDLVPSYTVFFSGCTLNCVYCQNWDISTRPENGEEGDPSSLAMRIESKGPPSYLARNINWVGGDPTSNLPFVLKTLLACGANLPQIWNSNMYLSERAMQLLDGVVDVYLTDFKYGNDECAERLSDVDRYTEVVRRNHLIARSHAEMIVRHLVLPGHVECCTRPVLTWISDNLQEVKVNVMAQYKPEFRAREFPDISRGLRTGEYEDAMAIAIDLGLDLCD